MQEDRQKQCHIGSVNLVGYHYEVKKSLSFFNRNDLSLYILL